MNIQQIHRTAQVSDLTIPGKSSAKLRSALFLALLFSSPSVSAVASDADYRIRAYAPNGSFTGSHALLVSPSVGYVEASYCDKTYWVRGKTFRWAQKKVKDGGQLMLERQNREGRRVICWHPQRNVKVDATKFGPSDEESLKLEIAAEKEGAAVGRMRSISSSFKKW